MSHAKILLISAGIVTALALGTAAYEFHRADSAAVDLIHLEKTQESLRAANAALAAKLTAATTNLAELTAQEKEAANKSVPPAVAPNMPAAPVAKSLWSNPDYGRLYVATQRATLSPRYGQLYRDLHLTPDQILKFEDIQTECQQSMVDIWTEAEARGLSTSDTSVTRLTADPHRLLEVDLQALLGIAGYEQYQNYDKGKDARELASALAANLYSSEAPLTAAQGAEFTKIIAANTETKMTRMRDDGKAPLYQEHKEINWAAVAAQAQGLLSAAQITALKQLGEQKRIESEFTSFLMNAPTK
jgi:hypothetical protein